MGQPLKCAPSGLDKRRSSESATAARGFRRGSWARFFVRFTGLMTHGGVPRVELGLAWRLLIRPSGCTEARFAHPTLLRVGYWWKSGYRWSQSRFHHTGTETQRKQLGDW